MKRKEKYDLFVQFYKEGIELKKSLENKATVNLSLLSLFVTGIFFNEKKLLDLIDLISIPNWIFFSLIGMCLFMMVLCLVFTINIFIGKRYKFLIPNNYMQIFFSNKFNSPHSQYDELILNLKLSIDCNASLNKNKSQYLRWSQLFLILSLIDSLIILSLITI
ncbi:MAG: hypothetical protein GXX78_13890 [Bacteroidales bacterium]|nr:hypothetical protein [Bacteroidales bacterium]